METPVEFSKKLPPLTIGFIFSMLFLVGSGAWTIRGIYEEFRHNGHRIDVNKDKIEYVDGRVDRKIQTVLDKSDHQKEMIYQRIHELEKKLEDGN